MPGLLCGVEPPRVCAHTLPLSWVAGGSAQGLVEASCPRPQDGSAVEPGFLTPSPGLPCRGLERGKAAALAGRWGAPVPVSSSAAPFCSLPAASRYQRWSLYKTFRPSPCQRSAPAPSFILKGRLRALSVPSQGFATAKRSRRTLATFFVGPTEVAPVGLHVFQMSSFDSQS